MSPSTQRELHPASLAFLHLQLILLLPFRGAGAQVQTNLHVGQEQAKLGSHRNEY